MQSDFEYTGDIRRLPLATLLCANRQRHALQRSLCCCCAVCHANRPFAAGCALWATRWKISPVAQQNGNLEAAFWNTLLVKLIHITTEWFGLTWLPHLLLFICQPLQILLVNIFRPINSQLYKYNIHALSHKNDNIPYTFIANLKLISLAVCKQIILTQHYSFKISSGIRYNKMAKKGVTKYIRSFSKNW